MKKKYVFIDLDGTILDYNTHSVPDSTIQALKEAKANGHELILTTGRPPGLFYGIDEELGFTSYIAANGRVAVHHGEIMYESPIPTEAIKKLIDICHQEKIDVAYEGLHHFTIESTYDDLYIKFCDHFNLHYPEKRPGFYNEEHVYQMNLFYEKDDFKRFEKLVPSLSFEYSCQYGIDVNTPGGFKELGIKEFVRIFDLEQDDIIVIGDGFNDISMLQYADHSIAMGNAHDDVKKHATYVTDRIENKGLYKAFKHYGLIT